MQDAGHVLARLQIYVLMSSQKTCLNYPLQSDGLRSWLWGRNSGKQDGDIVYFKMKRQTELKKLMEAYCRRKGLQMDQVRFLFDGRRLQEKDTPDELLMEDDNVIMLFRVTSQDSLKSVFIPHFFFHECIWHISASLSDLLILLWDGPLNTCFVFAVVRGQS